MTKKEETLEAPWTDEQVVALNHFTGKRYSDGKERILVATNAGWTNPEGGLVIQTWAWKFMTER